MRGLVRIKSFTEDPANVAAYGPVADETGRKRFELRIRETRKNMVIARIPGIGDREEAAALKGMRLYVPREALPKPEEDEFYHADLLGLAAVLKDGTPAGTVKAVMEAGETAVLEVAAGGETVLVPFTSETVPTVDLEAGRLVIDPPDEEGSGA